MQRFTRTKKPKPKHKKQKRKHVHRLQENFTFIRPKFPPNADDLHPDKRYRVGQKRQLALRGRKNWERSENQNK